MAHTVKQYDKVTLRWRAQVDLSGTDSVVFIMNASKRPDLPVVEKPATVDGTDPEILEVTLESDETATPGKYNVEFETHWPDGQIITFPSVGYERVTVVADLGGHLEESS